MMKLFYPHFIGVYDNALSSGQCKEIIKFLESQELGRGTFAHGLLDLQSKDDWELLSRLSDGSVVSNYILDGIREYTLKYCHTYPEVEDYQHDHYTLTWDVDDDYKLQKYDPGGGYFISHSEHGGGDYSSRMLVWMIYLNTVNDRGGTYFGAYDKTISAQEGRLVIWPAHWTHQHKGIVSKSETKYIATGWYTFK
tara:strand:- start:43 stop:627 length:585 start_codon:yes stop_codon:yes gene_type:complete